VSRQLVLAATTLVTAALLSATAATATAAPHMLVGLVDDAQFLYGNPDHSFPILKKLRAQVIRVDLFWGGRYGVARAHPSLATNPKDPVYDWGLYDRVVRNAARYKIKILFSITATPKWENAAGVNRAPRDALDLQRFAYAAARRYSGTFKPSSDSPALPAVRLWLAWNEPNNPVDLYPQYRRVGKRYVIQSAADYARICNAIYTGIHATLIAGEKVGCGATAPRGNNNPKGLRPSVSPLAFVRAVKSAGLQRFDAWAHHPYYGLPRETPATKPTARTAITLGNFGLLQAEVTRLYGPRRFWITEYGYQTNPPDPAFGVTWALQARYLTQAYAIGRDDSLLAGWQSGLFSSHGVRKPAFNAFRNLPH
jgi:hypothetical protein